MTLDSHMSKKEKVGELMYGYILENDVTYLNIVSSLHRRVDTLVPCLFCNKRGFLSKTTPESISGPGCSKLTTSLVNVLLKFQTLVSQTCQYFFDEKK